MPPKCLENIAFLCFERRFSKQNSVIRLKSNILALPKFLGWLRHCSTLNVFENELLLEQFSGRIASIRNSVKIINTVDFLPIAKDLRAFMQLQKHFAN